MKYLEENFNLERLRKISKSNLHEFASEIREFILDTLSVKAGHLGASLGVVELTIALHYYFHTPDDSLIWDVGHQSYPHKILTGRKQSFSSLRQKGGISGFPSRNESDFDSFGTGHSSTSISAITGMAIADKILDKKVNHIAVIGDASIVSGMAMEALNHLGSTDLDVLIILNDNSIGIDPSVGALKEHFFRLENGEEHSIFEDFGFYYKGVVDGHNFDELFLALDELKNIKKPKLLHVKTIKGKGYPQAEADQVKWHSPGIFNKETGEISVIKITYLTFQQIFGETIVSLMKKNEKIVAVTPAMLSGSNLISAKNRFPERVLDVGIAEQHAVTLAAGMAVKELIPYCTIYSTFLQRAYDQVIHDVALQNLPVVFCIDRAGIVGTDGATHHGYFDIAFLRSVPNMIITSPMNAQDFVNLLYTAQYSKSPIAIRYPKGISDAKTIPSKYEKVEFGKAEEIQKGSEIALLTFGPIGRRISKILAEFKEVNAEKFGHYKFLFCKPLDTGILDEIFLSYSTILTFEEGVLNGGFGDAVLEYSQKKDFKGKIIRKGYPDKFITHGLIGELEADLNLDENHLKKILNDLIQ